MGWARGVVQGKDVGYGVEATCEQQGCEVEIDRGLSYSCGGMPGDDEHSCNGFFCDQHLFACDVDGKCRFVCAMCLIENEAASREGEEGGEDE